MTMDNNTVTVLLVLIIVAGIVAYRFANRPTSTPTTPAPVRDLKAEQIIAEIHWLRDELRRDATLIDLAVPGEQEGR